MSSVMVEGNDLKVEGNALLSRLPAPVQEAIEAVAKLVPLEHGRVLHEFGEPTTALLFPLSGVISLTIPINNGQINHRQTVEVGLVGRDGFFGVGALLGDDRDDLQAIAQVRGSALEVPINAITPELRQSLYPLASRYAMSLMVEIAQTAGCNRVHSVEQRAARWLLQAADHAQSNEIELTHEFLSMMLAVRRASVTVVVGVFQRAGLIVAERGLIRVSDREGLLEIACSCYSVIRSSAPRYD